MTTPILEARDLSKLFPGPKKLFTPARFVTAVDRVSLAVMPGETLAIVGESGSGKSTLGRLLLRLLAASEGRVFYQGEEITHASGARLNQLRRELQIIFQDPFSSLQPRMPVGEIIGEAVREHGLVSKEEFDDYIDQVMDNCGLQPFHKDRYPHEFSGGQRQRICIARALALNPEFIVCDEPVSALDVSIQAQILNLLMDLKDEFNFSYLFIAHDLSVVRHISDRLGVMYLGSIVEMGDKHTLFTNPVHPYTKVLFAAVPTVGEKPLVQGIDAKGEIPSPVNLPKGCYFSDRCPYATDRCRQEKPVLREVEPGHMAACHLL